MCFSESQSYTNAIILLFTCLFLKQNTRLIIALIYLAIKDLIQGFLYKYQKNEKINNFFTILSWIHICFQPLVLNIFLSHFDQTKKEYWNIIFALCFIYGLISMMTLKDLNSCEDFDDDFCSDKTLSYLGKYHVGYKFKRNKTVHIINYLFYIALMFIPGLITNARTITFIWIFFVSFLNFYFNDVGSGEIAALWCFLSIIYAIPVSLYGSILL